MTATEPTILREICGYAIQWNVYGPAGKHGEIKNRRFAFLPGCFDNSLAGNHEIVLEQNCSGGPPVFACRSDGTLKLTSDETGLLVTATLLDTAANRLLLWKIDNGHCKGWSHRWKPIPGQQRISLKDGIFCTDHIRGHLLAVSLSVGAGRPRMLKTTPMFNYGGPTHVSPHAIPLT